MARKTTEELIAEEKKRAELARVRMAELKSRQKIEERKRDTHRKIVVGAAVMAHTRIDPRFRKAVQDALNKAVPEPKRRAAIPDMLDERAFQEAMRAAARKAAIEAEEAQEAVRESEKQPVPPTRPHQQAESARSHALLPHRDI